jgi:protein DGCR14
MAEKSTTELNPFKPPPDPSTLFSAPQKRRSVKVLDEDEYVAKVEQIVERDFFPELERLKARSDYIDAADRNDTTEMRRLQERFSTGRIPTDALGSRLPSPATFDTPVKKSSSSEDHHPKIVVENVAPSEAGSEAGDIVKGVSLDTFLAKHTSEDNESFYDLMQETDADFRRTHAWMFKEEEQLSIENKAQQLALPAIEDQAANARQEFYKPLDGWTYKNENPVFYPPVGVPMTDSERIDFAKKEKTIILENTRFKINPWKSEGQKGGSVIAATAKKAANYGKVGADGKDLIDPTATPSVGGFKLMRVADPSPMIQPGDASPFMTWGEVESTPYRLEGREYVLIKKFIEFIEKIFYRIYRKIAVDKFDKRI